MLRNRMQAFSRPRPIALIAFVFAVAVASLGVGGCGSSRQENCELCGPPIRLVRSDTDDIRNVTATGPCQVTYCQADECWISITAAGACHLEISGASGRVEIRDLTFEKASIHWDACCASYYLSSGVMVLPVLAATP